LVQVNIFRNLLLIYASHDVASSIEKKIWKSLTFFFDFNLFFDDFFHGGCIHVENIGVNIPVDRRSLEKPDQLPFQCASVFVQSFSKQTHRFFFGADLENFVNTFYKPQQPIIHGSSSKYYLWHKEWRVLTNMFEEVSRLFVVMFFYRSDTYIQYIGL